MGFVTGQIACAVDMLAMDFKALSPTFYAPGPFLSDNPILQRLDMALDIGTWLFNAGASALLGVYTNSPWQAQDIVFQAFQLLPVAVNAGYSLWSTTDCGRAECERDIFYAALNLIIASIFSKEWPSSYKNAPNAKGLVLSANIFAASQGISEILFVLLEPADWVPVQAAVKYVLFTVGNVLAFSVNMLELAHA